MTLCLVGAVVGLATGTSTIKFAIALLLFCLSIYFFRVAIQISNLELPEPLSVRSIVANVRLSLKDIRFRVAVLLVLIGLSSIPGVVFYLVSRNRGFELGSKIQSIPVVSGFTLVLIGLCVTFFSSYVRRRSRKIAEKELLSGKGLFRSIVAARSDTYVVSLCSSVPIGISTEEIRRSISLLTGCLRAVSEGQVSQGPRWLVGARRVEIRRAVNMLLVELESDRK
jgi:hypothetical protein